MGVIVNRCNSMRYGYTRYKSRMPHTTYTQPRSRSALFFHRFSNMENYPTYTNESQSEPCQYVSLPDVPSQFWPDFERGTIFAETGGPAVSAPHTFSVGDELSHASSDRPFPPVPTDEPQLDPCLTPFSIIQTGYAESFPPDSYTPEILPPDNSLDENAMRMDYGGPVAHCDHPLSLPPVSDALGSVPDPSDDGAQPSLPRFRDLSEPETTAPEPVVENTPLAYKAIEESTENYPLPDDCRTKFEDCSEARPGISKTVIENDDLEGLAPSSCGEKIPKTITPLPARRMTLRSRSAASKVEENLDGIGAVHSRFQACVGQGSKRKATRKSNDDDDEYFPPGTGRRKLRRANTPPQDSPAGPSVCQSGVQVGTGDEQDHSKDKIESGLTRKADKSCQLLVPCLNAVLSDGSQGCIRTFSRKADAVRHIKIGCCRYSGRTEPQVRCPKCGKLLSRKDSLQRHTNPDSGACPRDSRGIVSLQGKGRP
ncbi:hypothetical protein R3P38DRAFT_1641739 [Favolaschia claudopus]|uniref:C2H2-type domain-containing protein n=1 Tax=Favolaschia claudopus TaxID=2862362 RepID=A0AAW0DKK6_9AGAR